MSNNLWQCLETILPEIPEVYIVMHRRADLDAVASSYLLCKLISYISSNVKCRVIAPDGVAEATIDTVPKTVYKKIVFVDKVPRKKDILLIFVDVGGEGTLSEYRKLLSYPCRKWLIDHHISTESFRNKFDEVFIDPDASSTLEIILLSGWDKIRPKRFFNKSEIRLMLYALIVETRFLYLSGWRALKVISRLLEIYGDEARLGSFIKRLGRKPALSERIAILKGFQRMVLYRHGEFLMGITSVSAFQNIVSSKLVSSGLDIVIVYSAKAKKGCKIHIRISDTIRRRLHINVVEEIIKKLEEKYGGSGGGHAQLGNIQFPNELCSEIDSILTFILEILRERGLHFRVVD
jgi:nanoRNase/pAp phosphatase (c-di-AMP/oligoRNAs hydrolase)